MNKLHSSPAARRLQAVQWLCGRVTSGAIHLLLIRCCGRTGPDWDSGSHCFTAQQPTKPATAGGPVVACARLGPQQGPTGPTEWPPAWQQEAFSVLRDGRQPLPRTRGRCTRWGSAVGWQSVVENLLLRSYNLLLRKISLPNLKWTKSLHSAAINQPENL